MKGCVVRVVGENPPRTKSWNLVGDKYVGKEGA